MSRQFSLLALLFAPLCLQAIEACPDVSSISRVPGEYGWVSTDGRWEGYFLLPRVGRGTSSQVIGFEEARWIQLNNLNNSAGLVECDYTGNGEGEIIRFVTTVGAAVPKPTAINWSCSFNPTVPGVQCLCGGEPHGCRM